MQKNKKLLFGFVGGFLLLVGGLLRPAHALGDTTVFDTALQVSVSTTPTQPTQILAGIYSSADVLVMLNWSGSGTYPNSEFLLLSSGTVFSTSASTGTFRLPAGQRPSDYLYLNNFRGPLYGVVIGTTSAQSVSVLRKK